MFDIKSRLANKSIGEWHQCIASLEDILDVGVAL